MSSPFSRFPKQAIVLVKSDGQRVNGQAIVSKGNMTVFDAKFPVEAGDEIERTLPSGVLERYEVTDPGYSPGLGGIPAHYSIKVRNMGSRPPPASVVHNYNVSGQVAVVGANATAIGNTLVQHNTQQTWNETDRVRIADELAKLRAALVVEVASGDDPDDAIELGHVGHATKAVTAGDKDGFFGALKGFSKKTLAIAERLGLEYLNTQVRSQLGLPPGGSSE